MGTETEFEAEFETVPPVVVAEVVETADEVEARKKAAEEERRAKERVIELRIYKVRGRLELALEGLARATDKNEEAAWARIIKADYNEMDRLTKDHANVGGSSWSAQIRAFDVNYEKSGR